MSHSLFRSCFFLLPHQNSCFVDSRTHAMLRFSGWPSLLLAFAWGFALVQPSWSISDEIAALQAFKNAIYEDPFSRLSSWNPGDENPCQWTGLRCSYPQGSVISIVLSNSSLEGFLTPQLGMLHWLQELVLDNNLLIGFIPYQLSMLRNLLVLDLSVNQLSGSIPPVFGNLTSIRKIDLHSNRLIGSIPSELGQLANLVELWLYRNMLDGVIPGSDPTNMPASQSNASGLCQLTYLGVANFSYNYFIGKIPSCLDYLPRSSFQGNCFSNDGSIFQRSEDLAIVCNVVSLCLESEPTKRPSMQIITAMLEDGIDVRAAAVLKESSLPCWI